MSSSLYGMYLMSSSSAYFFAVGKRCIGDSNFSSYKNEWYMVSGLKIIEDMPWYACLSNHSLIDPLVLNYEFSSGKLKQRSLVATYRILFVNIFDPFKLLVAVEAALDAYFGRIVGVWMLNWLLRVYKICFVPSLGYATCCYISCLYHLYCYGHKGHYP